MKYDIDEELKDALCRAMDYEYSDCPDPEDLDYEYQFSAEFEKKMKRICRMAGHSYVSIGRHRVRRAAVVALVAVMIFVMTAGVFALQKLYVGVGGL